MGQFHIPTGRLTRGPACPDLRTYPVDIRDGRVWVDINGGIALAGPTTP
jgi:nitrite reductase/ring-hydroxylating ferredoxin subunit